MRKPSRKALLYIISVVFLGGVVYFSFDKIMICMAKWLIVEDELIHSDAVVVLYTGAEWYARLIEAATVHQKGFADKVVVNGNRKTDEIRYLEDKGFTPCCSWEEDAARALEVMGVPRKDIITISAEDAYDTISEALVVGRELLKYRISTILITTSKYHTRRARFIWNQLYSDTFQIRTVAADKDPFSPESWWKQGRQIRWVLAEYGGWMYYFWKSNSLRATEITSAS